MANYGSTLSSPICSADPWNSISKMPVIVALKETVSVLSGSISSRDVVAVDVDLLRLVVADAEADSVACWNFSFFCCRTAAAAAASVVAVGVAVGLGGFLAIGVAVGGQRWPWRGAE